MEDPSNRTAQEVLDDHLGLSEHWEAEEAPERIVEEDMRRNVSEDIVILSNRDAFRDCEGVRELARMLYEELPEHHSFEHAHISIEGTMAFLERSYEDDSVRVRDGPYSYLLRAARSSPRPSTTR